MIIPALSPYFHLLLAFHIVCFTAWMAGMFYLPRLYVYHCQTVPGSAESERFKIMERRLLKQITTPAMIATWFFWHFAHPHPGGGELACRLVVEQIHRRAADERLSWRALQMA